jgi:hypothetical protein
MVKAWLTIQAPEIKPFDALTFLIDLDFREKERIQEKTACAWSNQPKNRKSCTSAAGDDIYDFFLSRWSK